MKTVFAISTLALLAACSSGSKTSETTSQESPNTTTEVAAATDAAPAAFGQCAVCHKIDKDAGNGLGPNLHGVVGRKAASVAGFAYSPGMKDWGQTWTEANLDKYITNPRALVAGTKMSFAGQSDAAKRAEIIAWLKKNS
jgi:cytochrome c